MDLDRDLNKTIEMVNSKSTHRFDRIYPFATENVRACLSDYEFSNKDCLTVLGSGVQALYMFLKGARSVSTFDVNSLAIYYYEFLKAFILSGLDFSSYRKLFIKSFGNKDNTYKKILDYMDGDYKTYFKVLYDKYGSNILSNRKLFNIVNNSRYECVKYNDIFKKENLKILRNNISNFKFEFVNSDINNLKLNKNYDFMYFSNIMQYVSEMYNDNMINSLKRYRDVLMNLFNNLNENGIAYLSYIYGIDILSLLSFNELYLGCIEYVYGDDPIEYKSFGAFRICLSSFVDGASKDGVMVYKR